VREVFTGNFLDDVRRRALRRGVWFRSLDRLERGIMSLAAQLIDRVESEVLGVVLVKILRKLNDAMRSGFARCMEVFGFRRARMVAGQAVALGCVGAGGWADDMGFVRYLTFVEVNAPIGWSAQS
jgi:hypothetical protein